MQLRDSQTSELIAEGTPVEVAVAAEAFAAGEVLFDDAGQVDEQGVSKFDSLGMRQRLDAELTGLEAALTQAEAAPNDVELRRALRAAVRQLRDAKAAGRAKQQPAKDAQHAARERSRRRRDG